LLLAGTDKSEGIYLNPSSAKPEQWVQQKSKPSTYSTPSLAKQMRRIRQQIQGNHSLGIRRNLSRPELGEARAHLWFGKKNT
jgi:hypothetical protein